MRTRGLLIILFLFATALVVKADTIQLKDGRKIKCDVARQEGKLLRYWIGDSALSVPMERVERVERDDETADELQSKQSGVEERIKQLPEIGLSRSGLGSAPVSSELLSRLEANVRAAPGDKEQRQRLVNALLTAAYLQYQAGDFRGSKETFRQALSWDDRNVTALIFLADIYLKEGRYRDALSLAERATELDPNNQTGYYQLGAASYALEQLPKAIDAWRAALKIGTHPGIAAALAKAERELSTAREFNSSTSRFFNISFEGNAVTPTMQSSLLHHLDESYTLLRRRFDYAPSEKISVVFYTRQTFFNVTNAPGWAGALNDGKLRVPIGGLSEVNQELARTLTHELVHSFVYFKSRGKCPTWLNEGLAQILEGRSASDNALNLDSALPRLESLDGGFTGLSASQARLAYAYSLAAVEVLTERGMVTAVRILEDLGQNYNIHVALSRNTRFQNLEALERELRSRLGRQ